MNISFKRAFNYFIKDKYWKPKLFFLAIFLSISYLFKGDFRQLIVIIPIYGYLALLAHNLINEKKEILPDLISNIIDNSIAGLKYGFVFLCYFIPIYIMGVLFLSYISKLVIPIIISKVFMIIPQMPMSVKVSILEILSLKFLYIIMVALILSFPIILFLIALTAFSENLKIKDSFDFAKLISILRYSFKEYFLMFSVLVINFAVIYIFIIEKLNLRPLYFPNFKVLYLEIIAIIIACIFILKSIKTVFFKNISITDFIQECLFLALMVSISVISIFLLIKILKFQQFMIFILIIIPVIEIPIRLAWQYLLCQIYMNSLIKIKAK